jgi:hypothetical protein
VNLADQCLIRRIKAAPDERAETRLVVEVALVREARVIWRGLIEHIVMTTRVAAYEHNLLLSIMPMAT